MRNKLILAPDHGGACPVEKRGRERGSAMFLRPASVLPDAVSEVEYDEQFRAATRCGGMVTHCCVDADIKEIYQIQPGQEKTSGRSKNLHSLEQCVEPLMTTASGHTVGGGSELFLYEVMSKAVKGAQLFCCNIRGQVTDEN